MFEMIKTILIRYIEVDENLVTVEARLKDDLWLNSLDFIYIIMDLEELLDVVVSDEEIGNMKTVGDIEKCLEEKTGSKNK